MRSALLRFAVQDGRLTQQSCRLATPGRHIFAPRSGALQLRSNILQSRIRWNSTGATSSPHNTSTQSHRFKAIKDVYKERNRSLLMYSSAIFITALGLSYAAVPLYRAFCAATGFSGTPTSSSHTSATGRFEAERLTAVPQGKRIKVNFNAETSTALSWKFTPQQKFVTVMPGETSLAFYTAKNTSDKDIIGIATYNVSPSKVAPYFAKIECFCFEEQKLLAGEEIDMPLFFFIDKDFLDDPTMRDIDDVVLSYTFFKARRNDQGHLEPDADQATINESMGWSEYEHAEKKSSKPA